MDEVKRYSVKIPNKILKKINKMDAPVRRRITEWIDTNLQGCENPRAKGHALEGDLGDLWRYRVGDYRIVAQIRDTEIVIVIVKVAKRESVYK